MGATPLLHHVDVQLIEDVLVFSSHDDFSVAQAVLQIAREGGKVIQEPTSVGNKWVATVTTPEYRGSQATL